MFVLADLKEKKVPFVWYGGLCLLALLFTRITDFNGLYGQDSYEYVSYTNCLISYFTGGTNLGNYFWPLFYPLCGAVLSIVLVPTFALQSISIIALIVAAIYLEKIIGLLFKNDKAFARHYVALFFLLSPYVLRSSLVVMSDSLCTALLVAAFYYCIQYRNTLLGKHFVRFVFCSVATVTTRYVAFVVVIIPAILVGYSFIKNIDWKVLLWCIFITCVLLMPHLIIARLNIAGLHHHPWLEDWSVTHFFQNTFTTLDGKASYPFLNIIYSFFAFVHPAFCFMGVVFVVLARKQFIKTIAASGVLKMILCSSLLYSFFLAGIPFQNLRFLLLTYPLLLLILYPGFIQFANSIISAKSRLLLSIAIVVIQLCLFYRIFQPFYGYNQTERSIAARILRYPVNTTIYTFSIDGALKHYGVNNRLINLWKIKVDTIAFAKPAMILFNEMQFHEQWKDKNPMLNWEFIKLHHRLIKLEDLPGSWQLYEME